jgi:uncharacterized membrane protein (DUF373 family)
MERSGPHRRYGEFVDAWGTLSLYERFEQIVALTLTALIGVIVVIATWMLAKEVFSLAWYGVLNPLDPHLFQVIFGHIMILLIALEFKHSIVKVAAHREHVAQVKTVLLIALLAVARKFIILDVDNYPPQAIVSLAAVMVALGIAYWLVRDRDAREAADDGGAATP